MSNETDELFEAAKRDDVDSVKIFVEEKGVPVSVTNRQRQTIAHIAAKNGNLNMLKYVVDKEPTVLAAQDRNGTTVLQLAVQQGSVRMAEINYLEVKYHPTISNLSHNDFESAAVHAAIRYGHLDIVKYLIEQKKIDVNIRDNLNETTVFTAVGYKRRDIFNYLVEEKGANLTTLDRYGENILFEFIRTDDLRTMKYLLDGKKVNLDVDWQNNFGDTMLHKAAHSNRTGIIEYLVGEKHANVNVVGYNKMTPLHCAACRNHGEICKYLIEHGASTQVVDEKGETPAQKATDEQLVEYMKNVSATRTRRSLDLLVQDRAAPSQIQVMSIPHERWQRRIDAHDFPPTARLGVRSSSDINSPSQFQNLLVVAESIIRNARSRERYRSTSSSTWPNARNRIDAFAEDAVHADLYFKE